MIDNVRQDKATKSHKNGGARRGVSNGHDNERDLAWKQLDISSTTKRAYQALTKSYQFRIRAQRFLLTYSQIDEEFEREILPDFIQKKISTVKALPIGLEEHPTTGGLHIHCFIDGGTYIIVNNQDFFDFCGHHPNIEAIRVTPYKVWDYVGKDGNITHEEGESPFRPEKKGKGSADDTWHEITMATSRDKFLEEVVARKPRDSVLHFGALERYADWKYRSTPGEYVSCEVTTHLDKYPELADWVKGNLQGKPEGRPQSLVIFGPTRIGKTLWARSLGKHAYFPALFMLEGFEPTKVEYAVFDDLINGFGSLPNFKDWFGAQREFVIGDRYMKKQRITWGKPSIFIASTDPRKICLAQTRNGWKATAYLLR